MPTVLVIASSWLIAKNLEIFKDKYFYGFVRNLEFSLDTKSLKFVSSKVSCSTVISDHNVMSLNHCYVAYANFMIYLLNVIII